MSEERSCSVVKRLGKPIVVALFLIPMWGLSALAQGHTNAWNFFYLGSQPVGSTQSYATEFIPNESTTLDAAKPVQVLNQGLVGADFVVLPPEPGDVPCAGTITHSKGCLVRFTFKPRLTGKRSGAVQIYLANGVPFMTNFFSAVGTGSQVAFDPGAPAVLNPPGWDLSSPVHVAAIDFDGDFYVAASKDSVQGIWLLTGQTAWAPIVTGLTGEIHNIAIGPAGEVYYVYSASSTSSSESLMRHDVNNETVLTGLAGVQGLTVDTAGDIYIAQSNGDIVRYSSANDTHETLAIGKIAGVALKNPTGIAVDGDENIFIADNGNSRIVEIPSSGTPSEITEANNVTQIVVGGNGDLYIAQDIPGDMAIFKLKPGQEGTEIFNGNNLGGAFSPQDLAVDGAGNLYIVNGNTSLLYVNRTTGSLAFAGGVASSAQSFTLENIGNEPLIFPVGAVGKNVENGYTLPTGYALDSSTTCPVKYKGQTLNPDYSLAADANCYMQIDFEPAKPGPDNGAMVLTDNALNTANAQQTVALSGSAVQLAFEGCAIVGSAPACGADYTGMPIAVTVTAVPSNVKVSVTYQAVGGSALPTTTPPTLPGTYAVVATVTSPDYVGSLAGTLEIDPATAKLTFGLNSVSPGKACPLVGQIPNCVAVYNGSPIPVVVTTTPAGLSVSTTYQNYVGGASPTTTAPMLPGTYQVVSRVTENGYTGSLTGSLMIVDPPIWSPSPLNFGNVIEGTSSPFTKVVFSNIGAAPVNCNSTTYTSGGSTVANLFSVGLGLAGVTASSGTTAALPSGASCTFTFIYEPTAVGSLSVTLTIAGVTQPLTIEAAAVLPPITLAPAKVNFRAVVQGQTATQTLTLTNNTSTALSGIQPAMQNAAVTYYTLVPVTAPAIACTATAPNTYTLAANASCNFVVQYAPPPGAAGFANTLLVSLPFKYSTDEGPQTTWVASSELEGQNVTPAQAALTSSPGSAIIQEPAGGRSSSVTFTLTNSGGAPLNGIVWSNTKNLLTGPDASAFALFDGPNCSGDDSTTPPSSLPGAGVCNLGYELAAGTTAPGVYTATLSILTSLNSTPLTATLTGVIYPIPTLTPPSSGGTFNNIPLNTHSAPFTVTLTNPTAGPVTITNFSVVPTGASAAAVAAAADYKVTPTCGATLAAAPAGQQPSNCTFVIVFTPTSEEDGEYIPHLAVNTSYSAPAPVGTQALQLTSLLVGTVQPAPKIVLNPNPPALNFPSQTVGTRSIAQSATLSNTAPLSQVTLSPPVFTGSGAGEVQYTVSCDEAGFTAAGAGTLDGGNGAMCTYKIAFIPVAGGPSTIAVTMTIPTNAPSGNAVFNINGSALPAYTGRVVWIPDYEGQLLQVREGTEADGNANAITVQLPNTCYPTSVVVNLAYAFVFCSSAAGGSAVDELLAYDANLIRHSAASVINPAPLQTWVHGPSELDGVQLSTGVFDATGNLWYTANGALAANPAMFEILASDIPDGALTQFLDTPGILEPFALTSFNLGVDVISTINPTGMTFAPDGSLWIGGSEYRQGGPATGVFGILLNIPASQLGNFDGKSFTCLTTNPSATKCAQYSGDFNDPGGVAIFNNMLWVSVTGAAQFGVTTAEPGRELIGFPLTLAPTGDTLGAPVTFGSATTPAASPFVCPGSLFAQATGAVHLWISDDGYGDASKNPTCGGAGDTLPETGGVFDYTATQLSDHDATLGDILAYTGVTGRPGPGGIFVENDQ